MKPLTIEQRVAELERQVAQMQARQANGTPTKPWEKTAAMFTDDPGMLEIFEEAMKLREADRRKARRKPRKKARVSS